MHTYKPQVFEQADIEAAKAIILTNEGSVSTELRWQTETPYLCDKLLSWCGVGEQARVLDFGCGIGRMSRALLERTPATLWGADISATMRAQALSYVQSERFTALSPAALDAACAAGMHFDMALSVWVLQHCPDLDAEVQRLHAALRPGGLLFVVDMEHRAIPTHEAGWVQDAYHVEQALRQRFKLLYREAFAAPNAPANLRDTAWIGLFQQHE
jgi:2-polyprenyl-3-methyl-5-hydroxy-6-metoxy-1,4-benzoquinol methylase